MKCEVCRTADSDTTFGGVPCCATCYMDRFAETEVAIDSASPERISELRRILGMAMAAPVPFADPAAPARWYIAAKRRGWFTNTRTA